MGGELYGGQDPGALGPPDLAHAIQAARRALSDNYDWDGYDVFDVARLAVVAAAPVLLQATREDRHTQLLIDECHGLQVLLEQAERNHADALERLQATRDRLADLEVYAADLYDAAYLFLQHATEGLEPLETWDAWHETAQRLRAVLQTDPPARGRAILEEVERYRVYHRALALQVLAYQRAALDTPAERNALQGLLEIVEGFEETAGDLSAAQAEAGGG